MSAHKFWSYIYYLSDAVNQHGVHSPFVFDLTVKGIYGQNPKPQYPQWKSLRKELLHDKSVIEVKDFGAGSKIFKDNKRPVAKMAKVAGIRPKYAGLLMRIAAHLQAKKILELGTSLGLGSAAMALACPDAEIISLEGCPSLSAKARENHKKLGLENVAVHTGAFADTLPEVLKRHKDFDLVFIDGNHAKAPTLKYFKTLLPHLSEEALLIFDDIHWSADMEAAWKEISESEQIDVSIDLFQFGLAFVRKGQNKEHFIIKY